MSSMMNEMAPRETTMKPAPADTYISLTCTLKPLGAPSLVASSEREYCVFDMQTGSLPRSGSASYCAIRRSAFSEYSAPAPPYAPLTIASIFSLIGASALYLQGRQGSNALVVVAATTVAQPPSSF